MIQRTAPPLPLSRMRSPCHRATVEDRRETRDSGSSSGGRECCEGHVRGVPGPARAPCDNLPSPDRIVPGPTSDIRLALPPGGGNLRPIRFAIRDRRLLPARGCRGIPVQSWRLLLELQLILAG